MSQNVFKLRINIRQLKDILEFGKRNNYPVFILGGAGVGKSAVIQQYADIMFPNNKGNNVVDFRLSDKAPQDGTGIAVPIEREDGSVRTVFATPDWWPTDPDWEGFIFLDELTNADHAMQQLGYQIMLDRRFTGYTFPKLALPIGAGNREGDGGSTTTLLSPLVNRMILVEVDYDYTVWAEDYAEPRGIHRGVLGFLKQHPEKLYTGDDPNLEDGKPFCTPRAFDKVSAAFYELDKKLISDFTANVIIQGSVGEGMESPLMAYYAKTCRLPDLEQVLNGTIKSHALQPHEVDLIYVFGVSSLYELRKEIMDTDHYSNQEMVKRVGNWITFMFESFKAHNVDLVVGFVTQIVQDTNGVKAVLTMSEKRNNEIKMIPSTLQATPALSDLISTFMADHMELLSAISGK